MKKRILPQTILEISHICLGSANFGVPLNRDDTFAVLDAFIEAGGNFIDTARVYADWLPNGANASESTIGAWQKERGNRDKIIFATKGAHPDLKTMHVARMSPDDIQQDIETSLKYLQTDIIDLYWLHRDDISRSVGEILETLNSHVKAGKIRYFACSNWTVSRIQEAMDYAQSHKLSGFVANQPMWSLAEPNRDAISDKTIVIADEVDIEFHRETKMPMIPYTSQAKGYFSKVQTGKLKDSNRKQYYNAINQGRYERILELSQKHDIPITTISLSYMTSQAFPVIPIIGVSSLEQLESTLYKNDFVLTAEEIAYLEGRG